MNEAQQQLEPLLTVREAARLLQLSEWQIYEKVRRGDLPAIRFGRTIRFDRKKLLNGQAVSTTA